MTLTAGKYWSMRRLSDKDGYFRMVAIDQRPPIMNLIKEKKGAAEASYDDVALVKSVLARSLMDSCSAILLDPVWSWPVFHQDIDPQKGLVVTIEEHDFKEDAFGRKSDAIADWTVGKIKAMGGDAVKALAWYRPDADASINKYQQDWVQSLGDACKKYDIAFLFELLLYPLAGDADQTTEYREHTAKSAQHVIDSVEIFADPKFGVDVFKLESPVLASQIPDIGSKGSQEVQDWFDKLADVCPVPWVMLSAGANKESFKKVVYHASKAGASGYLAGRAIWLDAAQHYPDTAKMEAQLKKEGAAYMKELDEIVIKHGAKWFDHKSLGGKMTFEGAELKAGFPKFYNPKM